MATRDGLMLNFHFLRCGNLIHRLVGETRVDLALASWLPVTVKFC